MSAPHTPAPWRVVESHHADSNDSIRAARGQILAWIEPNDVGGLEAQANACLIAAAPELLDACRALLPLARAAGFRVSTLDDAHQLIERIEGGGRQ